MLGPSVSRIGVTSSAGDALDGGGGDDIIAH